MKILVFCPTYQIAPGALAIHPETRRSIDELQHGEHDVTVMIRPDPHEDKQGNVVRQYQWARQHVLDEGYDALLIIEHDMIVPDDALVKMAATDAGVVYGVYLFRHVKPTLNAFRAVSPPSLDQSIALFQDELAHAKRAGAWPVSGLGFGCTLIRRDVLEKIEIRRPNGGYYPDGPFASDCCKYGIKQMARFDVECGHIKPDGRVLWPGLENDWMYDTLKVKILVNFNGEIGGRTMPFVAGSEVSLPYEAAQDYARAGFCRLLDQTPAVKIIGAKNGKPTRVQAVK